MTVDAEDSGAAADAYTASVVGGTGFTGGELLRLLAGHPNFEVVPAPSRSAAHHTLRPPHPHPPGP
ncbi:hypothetical protein B9G38_11880, partial [Halorubrum sp. SD612]